MRVETRRQLEQAWLIAALPKMKQFPTLKDFLGAEGPAERRRQTAGEIEQTMRRWRIAMATAAAAPGGPLRRRRAAG